jgi:hypothetical protein
MFLLHLLAFRSEIRILIRLGRFGRRVGVDVANDFLSELLSDTTNERSDLPMFS